MIPRKTPDLKTKPAKYFLARQNGKSKKDAKVEAGYSITTPAAQIEKSDTYQEVEKRFYKDALLEKITMEEIASALADNIKQGADRSARNAAIKIALDKLEPEDMQKDEPDKVVVLLRG